MDFNQLEESDRMKYEIAEELGLLEKVQKGGWKSSIVQRDRKNRWNLKHQTESTGEKRKTGCCRIDGVIYSVSVPFA